MKPMENLRESLVKLALALQAEAELESLFQNWPPQTIDDVVNYPLKKRCARK